MNKHACMTDSSVFTPGTDMVQK